MAVPLTEWVPSLAVRATLLWSGVSCLTGRAMSPWDGVSWLTVGAMVLCAGPLSGKMIRAIGENVFFNGPKPDGMPARADVHVPDASRVAA